MRRAAWAPAPDSPGHGMPGRRTTTSGRGAGRSTGGIDLARAAGSHRPIGGARSRRRSGHRVGHSSDECASPPAGTRSRRCSLRRSTGAARRLGPAVDRHQAGGSRIPMSRPSGPSGGSHRPPSRPEPSTCPTPGAGSGAVALPIGRGRLADPPGAGHGTAKAAWAPRVPPKTTKRPRRTGGAPPTAKSGGVLLSQGVYPQVPSALAGLTAVFGMGTGVTPPPWPPETCCQTWAAGRRPSTCPREDSRASTSFCTSKPSAD